MEVSHASYQIIAELLAARTGQQLTDSRKWRLSTALSGIFRERGISNTDQLVCLLDAPQGDLNSSDLATEVVEALLNNETYFFRDRPTFDQLPLEILPELRQRRAHVKRLSIWCAGCSTGQEVHSLAMLFQEQKELWAGWTINILGTDISQKAISSAQQGLYSQFEVQRGLGVKDMLNHFDETPNGWQLSDNVRRFSRFEQHNLLGSTPGRTRFDLILCRNVLLYFEAANRARAFGRLAHALAEDGFLMLGAGETASANTDAFVPSGHRASIFEPKPVHNQELRKSA
jgi:chemotaxis protein methyltransferase CheR